jgi:hypothetical protein
MQYNSWGDQFNRATLVGELDIKKYERLLWNKELAMFYAQERIIPAKVALNKEYFEFLELMASIIENMHSMLKHPEFIIGKDFEPTIAQVSLMVVAEKMFASQTWCDSKFNKYQMESILFTNMRLAKILVYFQEKLTIYIKQHTGITEDFPLSDVRSCIPVHASSLDKLCTFISTEIKESAPVLRKHFRRSFPFAAVMKVNSVATLFMTLDTASIKKAVFGDSNWEKFLQIKENIEKYYVSKDEHILLSLRGEQKDMSRSDTERSERNKPDHAPAIKTFDPSGQDALYQKEAAEHEKFGTFWNQASDAITGGVLANAMMKEKEEAAKATLKDIFSGFSYSKGRSIFDEEDKNQETEEERMASLMSKMGVKREDKDAKDKKGAIATEKQALRSISDQFFNKLLTQKQLFDIYGVVMEQVQLPPPEVPEPRPLVQVPFYEGKNLNITNIQPDINKIDLGADMYEKFITDLANYLRDREKNLMEMKKVFEERERDERMKREQAQFEIEKRRGGWKSNRLKKLAADYKPPEAFISKRIDLAKVTNFTEDMFSYFDKERVAQAIESDEVAEGYENCIPEEELFDPAKEYTILDQHGKFDPLTFFQYLPRQSILEKKAFRNSYDYRLTQFENLADTRDYENAKSDWEKSQKDRKKDKFSRFHMFNVKSAVRLFNDYMCLQRVKKHLSRPNWTICMDVLVRRWTSGALLLLKEKDRKGLNRIYCIY